MEVQLNIDITVGYRHNSSSKVVREHLTDIPYPVILKSSIKAAGKDMKRPTVYAYNGARDDWSPIMVH
jgi:hypothetical protein